MLTGNTATYGIMSVNSYRDNHTNATQNPTLNAV